MGMERRQVLQAGGALAAAGALAACGSSSDGGAAATSAPAEAAPTVAGFRLFPVAEVPVGGGKISDADEVVVTQPAEGEIRAFSAVCTHAGCLVSEVRDNEIYCPCHGSLFSAEDGSVIQGPATEPLPAVAVAVSGGDVLLT